MTVFKEVELTNGEFVWAEVDPVVQLVGRNGDREVVLTNDIAKTFNQFLDTMKHQAETIRAKFASASPEELEIEFGFTLAGEAGNTIWGLTKMSSEGSIKLTLKWKAEKESTAKTHG